MNHHTTKTAIIRRLKETQVRLMYVIVVISELLCAKNQSDGLYCIGPVIIPMIVAVIPLLLFQPCFVVGIVILLEPDY